MIVLVVHIVEFPSALFLLTDQQTQKVKEEEEK